MERPACAYGISCYRKNPQHFLEYSHPNDLSPNDTPTTLGTQTVALQQRGSIVSSLGQSETIATTIRLHTEPSQTIVTLDQTSSSVTSMELATPNNQHTEMVVEQRVAEREVIAVNDSSEDELPPLVPLLRQLSLSAKSGLLGSEERAHLKDLLLSGNRNLVLSAATILESIAPSLPLASVAPSTAPCPSSFDSPFKTETKQAGVMYILRGISGSGKSTLSAKLTTNEAGSRFGAVCSTDDFFVDSATGQYEFDPSRLNEAHTWNQNRVKQALQDRISPVVVDNTHTQRWEAQPYVVSAIKFGYEVRIQEPTTWWAKDASELAKRNQHGVPLEAIQRMLDRWESDFSIEAILASRPPARRKPQKLNDVNRRDRPPSNRRDLPMLSGQTSPQTGGVSSTNSDHGLAQDDGGWQQVTKKSHSKR